MKEYESLAKAAEAAMQGDRDGFAFIYEKTYKTRYYIALKYMNNADDAADVVSDAYVKAWERIGQLADPEKVEAWLSRIVVSTALDTLKKKNPLLFASLGEDDETSRFLKVEDERDEIRPEVSYTKKERQEILAGMVDSLADEQRICVLMHYVEEMSVEEIAQMLDCPKGTVLSRLNYARKHLKKQAEILEKKGYNFFGLAPVTIVVRLLVEEAAEFTSVPAKLALPGAVAGGAVAGATGVFGTIGGKITLGVVGAAMIAGLTIGGVYMTNRSGSDPEVSTQAEATPGTDRGAEQPDSQQSQTKEVVIADADVPGILEGGINRKEFEAVLAAVPQNMKDGHLTKREVGKVLCNIALLYEDQSMGLAAESMMDKDKANHLLAAVSDYQFTDKASSVPYARVVGDKIYIGYSMSDGSEGDADGFQWMRVSIDKMVRKADTITVSYTREGYLNKRIVDGYDYYYEREEGTYRQSLEATMTLLDDGRFRVREVKAITDKEKTGE